MELGHLGGGGTLSPSARVLGGRAALRKFLGSKEQESLSESMAGFIYLSMRIHPKSYCIFPLKVGTTLLRGSRKGAVRAW